MKHICCLMVVIFLSIFTISEAQIRIAASSNLRIILEEIKAQYQNDCPKAELQIVWGSSGFLSQQIMNGATFDIFMSADKIYPDKLSAQGVAGEVKTYAFGKLVIWSSTLDVSKGVELLLDDAVKRIAIAKPAVAPYGARAIECLKFYGIFDKVKSKLVYADNIAQAAQFAQSGNAEVAFLAQALVFTPDLKGKYFYLDSKSYKPVEQACVQLKNSDVEAGKFMKYLLSSACIPIFEKYGFTIPNK